MSQPEPSAAHAPVGTAGAWLGFGIALRAALGAVAHFAPLVLVAGIPLLVDLIDRNARAAEVPPEFTRVTDLWLELASIVGPYARVAGGSGVLIGVTLFVTAGFLVRGSEAGRRVSRVLLVLDAAHSVAATVWMSAIALGPLGEWASRYAKATSDLAGAAPGFEARFPFAFGDVRWIDCVTWCLVCLVSLGIDGALFWLAGRGFVRDWCAARSTKQPVASAAAAR